jgi:hypothetical protein
LTDLAALGPVQEKSSLDRFMPEHQQQLQGSFSE